MDHPDRSTADARRARDRALRRVAAVTTWTAAGGLAATTAVAIVLAAPAEAAPPAPAPSITAPQLSTPQLSAPSEPTPAWSDGGLRPPDAAPAPVTGSSRHRHHATSSPS